MIVFFKGFGPLGHNIESLDFALHDEFPAYYQLWAKTTDEQSAASWHPLFRHALDVAAVADHVLKREPDAIRRHSDSLGWKPEVLQAMTLWLVALHDIGKASIAFQWKVPDLWSEPAFGPRPSQNARHYKPAHHAGATAWYLHHDSEVAVQAAPGGPAPVAGQLLQLMPGKNEIHDPIISAIAGHHGAPVDIPCSGVVSDVGPKLILAARQLVADLAAHFGLTPAPLLTWDHDPAVTSYAWYLATLLPFADWVGSNQRFFQPDPSPVPMAQAWETSRTQAADALRELGLLPSPVSPGRAQNILPGEHAPSPVQDWALHLDLPEGGPVLVIVEEATGSGKTEAALMLAHRMMENGLARGFFVALPTMATANAMYARLKAHMPVLFTDDPAELSRASLALAHGRSGRQVETEPSVSGYCAPWIAHENRRAFFAQAGAGTIDQAVLSVLASKYQTLRLRGLADKVLIIDEAHAFDAYVSEEVAGLLRFHASQGGSAILLSATLPSVKRNALARAFAQGADWRKPPKLTSQCYPLTTIISPSGITETALTTRPGTERQVAIARVASNNEVLLHALAAARDGATVAIIKTTVDTAIATYEALAAESQNDDAMHLTLFHARFLPKDRDRVEQAVLKQVGKDGTPDMRRGQIVVATQVIEQSLDLDFDILFSDLAPVDLLIQRAGRLWRHDRNGKRPSSITTPTMHVLSPAPPEDPDDKWLDETLPEAVWVYRDAALLWHSARAVFSDVGGAGEIVTRTLSNDADVAGHPRTLVEAVYSESGEDLPSRLQKAADEELSRTLGEKAIAKRSIIDPRMPYDSRLSPFDDDARVMTRLGDSVTVRVARSDGGGRLVPLFSGDGTIGHDWADAELRLSPAKAANLSPPTVAQAALLKPAWQRFEDAIRLLVLAPDPDATGVWVDDSAGIAYTATLGLTSPSPRG